MLDETKKLKLQKESLEKIISKQSLILFEYASEIENIKNEISLIKEMLKKKNDLYYAEKLQELKQNKKISVLKYEKEAMILRKALLSQETINKKINELSSEQVKKLKK